MLPEYDWQAVGETSPLMGIHKTTGELFWNPKAHQMLGFPRAVCIQYDEGTNSIKVCQGFDYAVSLNDAGRYFIGAIDPLTECGLVFPLTDHITGEPVYYLNSFNSLIFSLEA